ncbi:MAG: HRDC domain-containing protein [Candidatus Hydrogenedentes bacterium]|nr:HRDC domain-containing protein [Candidatus Hydrogenedentota bacterium]
MEASTPPPYQYIDTTADLGELVPAIRGAERVGVDMEANSLHHYFEKVCLLQMTVSGKNYIVDPLGDIDLSDLLAALAETDLIFHAADYDMRMMLSSFGFRPERPVFDTMIAAQLVGEEGLGLVTATSNFLGVELTKDGQKSNWAQRPLTERQLEYASDDTRYLESLATILGAKLVELGREAWHREWCARVVDQAAQPPRRDPEDAWRIKGAGKLQRRELAYLRAIWRWRDGQAQEIDKPAFRVLSNPQLISLAEWGAANPGVSLKQGPRLPKSCSNGQRYRALCDAIASVNATPEAEWPVRRKGKGQPPMEDRLKASVRKLQDSCAKLGEELALRPSIIAPRAALIGIARDEAKTPTEIAASSGLMSWQAALMAPIVNEVFHA